MARRLAGAGYRVIAIARSNTDELTAAAQAAAAGGRIEFRAADLSQIDQLAGLARSLHADFGAPYGLINNAGSGTGGVLGMMRDEEIERLLRLNTLAPIILSKYVARSMMTARAGRIINIASVTASTGYSGLSVYSATKAALLGFTRSLARELGSLDITVNAIAPGFIDTDMTKDLSDSDRAKIAGRSALRRLAEADDVARSAEFLLGEGGRNITGSVVTVDAGNTA